MDLSQSFEVEEHFSLLTRSQVDRTLWTWDFLIPSNSWLYAALRPGLRHTPELPVSSRLSETCCCSEGSLAPCTAPVRTVEKVSLPFFIKSLIFQLMFVRALVVLMKSQWLIGENWETVPSYHCPLLHSV